MDTLLNPVSSLRVLETVITYIENYYKAHTVAYLSSLQWTDSKLFPIFF